MYIAFKHIRKIRDLAADCESVDHLERKRILCLVLCGDHSNDITLSLTCDSDDSPGGYIVKPLCVLRAEFIYHSLRSPDSPPKDSIIHRIIEAGEKNNCLKIAREVLVNDKHGIKSLDP